MAAAVAVFSGRVGAVLRALSGAWYGFHMSAADRVIRRCLPLVNLVLEVRDARILTSSAFAPLGSRFLVPSKHLVVLNKFNLADLSETKKWMAYMKQRSCSHIAVNSRTKESVKELLNTVRARISKIKLGESDCTGTVVLVRIPNVGKSATVNTMHQIGRIGAVDGFLSALAGNQLEAGPRTPVELISSMEEYKKWENLTQKVDMSENYKKRRQYTSDHTQYFIVRDVRRVLFEIISSFKWDLGKENELRRLVQHQFLSLKEALRVFVESGEDMRQNIATKLLNLYRTGRLGCYTLDGVPDVRQQVAA